MQLWPVFTNHWTELMPVHFPRVGEELKRCSCFAPHTVCAFALHRLRARQKGIGHRNTNRLSFLKITRFMLNFQRVSMSYTYVQSRQSLIQPFNPEGPLFVELKLKIGTWSVYISFLVSRGTTVDTILLARLLSTTQRLLHCSYCLKKKQNTFLKLGFKFSVPISAFSYSYT